MRINLQARAQAGERKRDKTRQALISAAMRMIAERGPHGASIEQFTAAAGVSRGTFYNYFPTIDDLLMALMDDVVLKLDKTIEATMVDTSDPAERMAHSCMAFIRQGIDDPLWGWVFLKLDSTSVTYVVKARERFQIEFEHGVQSGRFRASSVVAAYAMCAGSVRMAVRSVLNGADRACAGEIVQLILTGLGVDAAEARRICQARWT